MDLKLKPNDTKSQKLKKLNFGKKVQKLKAIKF